MTASAASIIRAGLSPHCAPVSRNGRAMSRSRSRTVRSNPLRSSEPASLPPTLPSPIKPILMSAFPVPFRPPAGRCPLVICHGAGATLPVRRRAIEALPPPYPSATLSPNASTPCRLTPKPWRSCTWTTERRTRRASGQAIAEISAGADGRVGASPEGAPGSGVRGRTKPVAGKKNRSSTRRYRLAWKVREGFGLIQSPASIPGDRPVLLAGRKAYNHGQMHESDMSA